MVAQPAAVAFQSRVQTRRINLSRFPARDPEETVAQFLPSLIPTIVRSDAYPDLDTSDATPLVGSCRAVTGSIWQQASPVPDPTSPVPDSRWRRHRRHSERSRPRRRWAAAVEGLDFVRAERLV
jgi:sarcosine oxidase